MRICLLAALAALAAGAASKLASPCTYSVTMDMTVPVHGRIHAEFEVQLTPLQRDGSAIVSRLDIGAARLDDALGTHPLGDRMGLSRFALYYWQADDGTLLDVAHHAAEPAEALALKKQLVSQHQIYLPNAGRGKGAASWRRAEADAHGTMDSAYEARTGLLGI